MQPKAGGKLHLRLNTVASPIADKYREGKLKRTLKREFKSTWNRLEANGWARRVGPRNSARPVRPAPGARPARCSNTHSTRGRTPRRISFWTRALSAGRAPRSVLRQPEGLARKVAVAGSSACVGFCSRRSGIPSASLSAALTAAPFVCDRPAAGTEERPSPFWTLASPALLARHDTAGLGQPCGQTACDGANSHTGECATV